MVLSSPPSAPRFEHHTDDPPTIGIGTAAPRLSWIVPTADQDYRQTAYEVQITRGGLTEQYRVEGSEGGEQVLVPWPAAPLASRESASVRIRVACSDDWSDWGDPAVVETGLVQRADWSARFVSPIGLGGLHMPAPVLRGSLEVPGEVRSARLYATAHGVYQATLNGRRVGDLVLAPGWTTYQARLRYQTYDVSHLVHAGENVLEVLLGNGWYRGRLGFTGERAFYGDRLALLAQLEVTTSDGRIHVLGTDGSWTARESEILADDLYDGQHTDLRRRGADWRPATGTVEVLAETERELARLVAPEGPPIRITDTLPARRVWTSPAGRTLVDFGQNAVGWVRLRARGLASGNEVTVRHAEVLEDGELGVRPLRTARATDSYLVAGPGASGKDDGSEELLEPAFTFHGFRYAEVTGIPDLRAADLELVVIGSDLRRTGRFDCSHELLSRLHENVRWSMRGNFVDVPTDCPQRDERLGWTGDIQVFTPTATFLYDTAGFLGSWLADLAAEQADDGAVPFVVPDMLPVKQPAAAAWGDAATLVPWALYQRTGDRGVLQRQLPSMRRWVDAMAALAGRDRLWSGGFQFGDWLDPTAPPDAPDRAKADPDVVATAHLARSAQVVADAARLLGRDEEAETYATLAEEVRAAFVRAYVTPAGRVLSDAQTAYALAIEWALLPNPEQREEAGRRLADLVRVSGFRISTGFVGTPLVTDALSSTGHTEVAYRLLLQTGCPSWLYPVTMGATTIWERWDSMLPDGSINPGEMTSFNHYALGAVADWLHRRVAGLGPAAPGYREIVVRPEPTQALSHASAAHLTPYGEAGVAWERADGKFRLRATVPVGASAHVQLPGSGQLETVGHGEHHWEIDDPVVSASSSAAPVTVRDVLDHSGAWSAIVAAAGEAGLAPGGEPQLASRAARFLDAPSTELIGVLSQAGFGAKSVEFGSRVQAILDLPES